MKIERQSRFAGPLYLHVGLLVDESKAVLQTPEAADAAARDVLRELVARLLRLLIDILQHGLNHLSRFHKSATSCQRNAKDYIVALPYIGY